MGWWVIPMPVVAIVVVVYGITTHRRWVWAIAGAYVVVSLLLFLFPRWHGRSRRSRIHAHSAFTLVSSGDGTISPLPDTYRVKA